MLKQLFNQMKNTFAILLVFFVIISMTASAVSALSHTHMAIPPDNTVVHIISHSKDIQTLTGNLTKQGLTGPVYTSNKYVAENPYSIACVYKVTDLNASEPSGCKPYYTNTTPNGCAGAIAIVLPFHDPTAAMDLQKFSTDFELPQADFQVINATGDSWPYITTTPPT